MLQAILFPKRTILGSDVPQLLTALENQVQGYEQQSGDKIPDAIKLGVVFHHLPDASLREHLLLNSRVCDTYALMAAEIRTVAVARTTWSGPTPMDLSTLAKDAKDCWCQTNKESGKGKKGQKVQGKGTKRKDGDAKKKGACRDCGEVGHFADERPKKKESNKASSGGGGDVHCSMYTDDLPTGS